MPVFDHSFGKPAALLAALLLAAPSQGAAQQEPLSPGAQAGLRFATPVDLMPPAIRDAYIRGIREELVAHGYDAGPVEEAVLGGRLAAAIALYQQDAGLAVDGVVSRELLDHLKFSIPKVYAALTVSPEAAEAESQGPEAAVQAPEAAPQEPQAVPQEGEAPPREESRYDPAQPRKAEGQDLKTGRVFWPDQVTAEALPDLPEREAPVQQANRGADGPPDGPESVAPKPESETPLGVVSLVQKALKEKGYFAEPIDGVFGATTSDAVRRFQQDSGLPASGVIDSALLGVLISPGTDGPAEGSAGPEESETVVNL